MQIFIQWKNPLPVLYGQMGDDSTAEEVMEFATKCCSPNGRVKSVSLVNGDWLVKMINLEKCHERQHG